MAGTNKFTHPKRGTLSETSGKREQLVNEMEKIWWVCYFKYFRFFNF